MTICGFQKLTLLDFPGHVAATVFTGGCNLRCPFCHNAGLVTGIKETPVLDTDEVLDQLSQRKGVLDGVCITGGEPTLQPDLIKFIRKLKGMGYAVKLDTNGTNPELLRSLLLDRLVDYVAMDIKAAPSRYGLAAGRIPFDMTPIETSVRYLKTGIRPYEFRTTVVKGLHIAEDFREIGNLIAGADRYFLQGFVDSGHTIGAGFAAFDKSDMERFLAIVREQVPNAELRGIE